MKINFSLIAITLLMACNSSTQSDSTASTNKQAINLQGTWKLLSGTLIENNKDTTITDYTKTTEFIKIINDTHFAFLSHDSTTKVFSAGGGHYALKDSLYTEHLEFCSDREWEGHAFEFAVSIHDDTLIQKGNEVIDSLHVNRLNIEKYVRLKQ